eukprot:TRINITY_DN3366_c5_g1_i1.p1 TRINITY_DN3366_c5_g1~~TRINITY_DN3366_c5_g1_i1.p1  ORF type:complete len:106 (+),score=21.03 TRINITY_DN3366_c5_g1_i1:105-422(+)
MEGADMAEFVCAICGFRVPSALKVPLGTPPPFHSSIKFLEDVWVVEDPDREEPRSLCIGTQCNTCGRQVCPYGCGVFFGKRWCKVCGTEEGNPLPKELLRELGVH